MRKSYKDRRVREIIDHGVQEYFLKMRLFKVLKKYQFLLLKKSLLKEKAKVFIKSKFFFKATKQFKLIQREKLHSALADSLRNKILLRKAIKAFKSPDRVRILRE